MDHSNFNNECYYGATYPVSQPASYLLQPQMVNNQTMNGGYPNQHRNGNNPGPYNNYGPPPPNNGGTQYHSHPMPPVPGMQSMHHQMLQMHHQMLQMHQQMLKMPPMQNGQPMPPMQHRQSMPPMQHRQPMPPMQHGQPMPPMQHEQPMQPRMPLQVESYRDPLRKVAPTMPPTYEDGIQQSIGRTYLSRNGRAPRLASPPPVYPRRPETTRGRPSRTSYDRRQRSPSSSDSSSRSRSRSYTRIRPDHFGQRADLLEHLIRNPVRGYGVRNNRDIKSRYRVINVAPINPKFPSFNRNEAVIVPAKALIDIIDILTKKDHINNSRFDAMLQQVSELGIKRDRPSEMLASQLQLILDTYIDNAAATESKKEEVPAAAKDIGYIDVFEHSGNGSSTTTTTTTSQPIKTPNTEEAFSSNNDETTRQVGNKPANTGKTELVDDLKRNGRFFPREVKNTTIQVQSSDGPSYHINKSDEEGQSAILSKNATIEDFIEDPQSKQAPKEGQTPN